MTKTVQQLQDIRRQGLGEEKADLVIKNVTIFNVITGELEKGDIAICGDTIVGVYDSYDGKEEIDGTGLYAVSGFINRHVHIDSAALNPYAYEELVLPRGTTTSFWDPHEIANVAGEAGLDYALACADSTVMDLLVQISSCVPATKLETAGAELDAAILRKYKGRPHAYGLAELMSTGDILAGDDDYMQKIHDHQDCFLSGHAPLESGKRLNTLRALGIRDCHESTSPAEGWEKLKKGMSVLIREGTVCKNLADLFNLIQVRTAPHLGFCTDDRKPTDIVREGDIDHLIRSAIRNGADRASVYRIATLSAAQNGDLKDRGFIGPGYKADIVLLSDLDDCRVEKVIKSGRLVTPELFAARRFAEPVALDSVKLLRAVRPEDFALRCSAGEAVDIIGLIRDQIVTEHQRATLPVDKNGVLQADIARDILKIAMVERHGRTPNGNIGISFVRGFGFKGGAVSFTVSHDAHNLGVIGTNDADMALAANRAKEIGGGFVAVRNGQVLGEMSLPMGGLMIAHGTSPQQAVAQLEALYKATAGLEPSMEPSKVFLAASFAPLGVIPAMGVSDYGPIRYDVVKGDKAPVLLQDQRKMLGLGPR